MQTDYVRIWTSMSKLAIRKIIVGGGLAVMLVAAFTIYCNERFSNPVWNSVNVDGASIWTGQSWGSFLESMDDAQLESSPISYGYVPRKDDALTGVNVAQSVFDRNPKVSSIYYDVEENVTDCVIKLAGVRTDTGTYDDVAQVAGPETIKTPGSIGTTYIWIEKDNALVLFTDEDGGIRGFDLYYDRKGFEGRFVG